MAIVIVKLTTTRIGAHCCDDNKYYEAHLNLTETIVFRALIVELQKQVKLKWAVKLKMRHDNFRVIQQTNKLQIKHVSYSSLLNPAVYFLLSCLSQR